MARKRLSSSKLSSKLVRVWNKTFKAITCGCTIATFLMIPVCIIGIVYYFFLCYNLEKAVMCCAMLWLFINANIKL